MNIYLQSPAKKQVSRQGELEDLHRLRSRETDLKILRILSSYLTGKTTLGKIRDKVDSSPFKVLISTILSARTKDKVTEAASERLFARFPDIQSLSRAENQTIADMIKPVLYHNVKSKRLVEVSRRLLENYSGKVPDSLDELIKLPGVGRKTANCVLVYGFGKPAIPVDVHVHRVSNRIGIVRTKTPEETEAELSSIYEMEYWLDLNELFVRFGQTTCLPINPRCEICPISKYCNYFKFEN